MEVLPSRSLFLHGMKGTRLPIAVAHGEGRAEFRAKNGLELALATGVVALRFVDAAGRPAETYPANPNGSPGGIAGLTSRDGRFTILMPHPERVFRTVQYSWPVSYTHLDVYKRQANRRRCYAMLAANPSVSDRST